MKPKNYIFAIPGGIAITAIVMFAINYGSILTVGL